MDPHAWQHAELWWKTRASRMGDAYVGRMGENYVEQTQRILAILGSKITGYYEKALDYGCGWGRAIPLLSKHCGHIWAADILDAPLIRAGTAATNVTPIKCTAAGITVQQMNLIVVVSVLHYITDASMFIETLGGLKKAAAPGCRFIVIDNDTDKDYHVCPRQAPVLANALGLTKWTSERVTINKRKDDHVLVDGTNA